MRCSAGRDDDCGTLMSATAFGYVLASPGIADKTLQRDHAARRPQAVVPSVGVVMVELRPHFRRPIYLTC